MVAIFITYFVMLFYFLLVDAVMIAKFIGPMFQSNLSGVMREQFHVLAATAFYILYVFGTYWFGTLAGSRAGSVLTAFLSGAFLGILAYGTFEITGFSIFKGWTLQMVVFDMIWGAVLTGSTAAVGFYVTKYIS